VALSNLEQKHRSFFLLPFYNQLRLDQRISHWFSVMISEIILDDLSATSPGVSFSLSSERAMGERLRELAFLNASTLPSQAQELVLVESNPTNSVPPSISTFFSHQLHHSDSVRRVERNRDPRLCGDGRRQVWLRICVSLHQNLQSYKRV